MGGVYAVEEAIVGTEENMIENDPGRGTDPVSGREGPDEPTIVSTDAIERLIFGTKVYMTVPDGRGGADAGLGGIFPAQLPRLRIQRI